MLKIDIYDKEKFDEKTNKFIKPKFIASIQLEHSLVSISKWESKWHKPFLSDKYEKTDEEIYDYIKCMTITQNVDDSVYAHLTNENIKVIKYYMEDKHTATTFHDERDKIAGPKSSKRKTETLTAELIYYYMFSCQIPKECEKWHINKLLTLIRVFSIKNDTENNKMSKKDVMKRNASLNAARRKALHSKG